MTRRFTHSPSLRAKRSNLRSVAGQAAIEFIACMVVIFFFLLFYLSLCMLLVTSEYVDYATFMAARTYKPSYGSENSQEAYARLVFDSYTEKIQGIARNFTLEFVKTNPNDVYTGGVTASYDIDLFYLPPLFVTDEAPVSKIRLSTESHLGREPTFEECLGFFQNFVRGIGVPGAENLVEDMDDNGC